MRSRRAFLGWLGGSAVGLAASVARAAELPPEPVRSVLPLPPRPAGAETGSAFLERTSQYSPADFEEAVFDAIASGNVPAFERELAPVDLSGRGPSGAAHTARIFVVCDYLAVGCDHDFARMPMLPATAQRIATACGASLPTTRVVAATYEAAEVKLAARTMTIDADRIRARAAIAAHHRLVELSRTNAGGKLGALTAGCKKDIVITNQLAARPGRVAIYGWQREDGAPIQRLSTIHDRRYADYSHGVRLVSTAVVVDGRAAHLEDLLRDPELAPLVSDEGPLRVTSYPV
jgi:hypothetical protein